MKKATIILPTSGDRFALLKVVIGFVQQQTFSDWELFIIGDGVTGDSVHLTKELSDRDDRITFVEHEKHPRRGEEYRDAVLRERATGDFVTYLCDRDIYLPHYLASVADALNDCDFVQTLGLRVFEDSRVSVHSDLNLGDPKQREAFVNNGHHPDRSLPLSGGAHRMDVYRKMDQGWATTPEGVYTDHHMWVKMLSNASLSATCIQRPGYLYFKREDFPGPPVAERAADLRRWAELFQLGNIDVDLESIQWLHTEKVRLENEVDKLRTSLAKYRGHPLARFERKVRMFFKR